MNLDEKKRTSKLAEYCLQCFSPMVTVKNKMDCNKHNQNRCSVSSKKKHKYTCLNTSCLKHSWICQKHADENIPLIEAHYNEFNTWDQQIPAQITETHMPNKLGPEKSNKTQKQAQPAKKKTAPQTGGPHQLGSQQGPRATHAKPGPAKKKKHKAQKANASSGECDIAPNKGVPTDELTT